MERVLCNFIFFYVTYIRTDSCSSGKKLHFFESSSFV